MKSLKGKGAWMAKVGEKGQIVIPKEAREMFDIAPGDTLLLLGDVDRGLAILSGDAMATIAETIFGGTERKQVDESHNSDEPDQEIR